MKCTTTQQRARLSLPTCIAPAPPLNSPACPAHRHRHCRASGRLANLTLRATAGACVAHTRGRLTVQGCTLECDACGLPHLAAPLLTRAVSSLPPPRPPATPAGAAKRLPDAPLVPPAAGLAMPLTQLVGQKRPAGAKPAAAAEAAAAGSAVPAAKRLRAWHSACGVAAGAGVLKVLETRIKVGGRVGKRAGGLAAQPCCCVHCLLGGAGIMQSPCSDHLMLHAACLSACLRTTAAGNCSDCAAAIPSCPCPSFPSRAAGAGAGRQPAGQRAPVGCASHLQQRPCLGLAAS